MEDKNNLGVTDPAVFALDNLKFSENSAASFKLRRMMENAVGEDKCTLCKAAEALEKADEKEKSSWSNGFTMFMLGMIPMLFGGTETHDPKALKNLFDALSKAMDSEESKEENAAHG